MKFIISQALNMKHKKTDVMPTAPIFLDDTIYLASALKKYSPWDLKTILNTNEKIASEAFVNYQEFDPQRTGHPAIFLYNGLVYKNLQAANFSDADLNYAQGTMRILSGFYGALRPLDGIHPNRLELQTKIKIDEKNLYTYWNSKLYSHLYNEKNVVINLASEEYAKCVKKYLKPNDICIDILFQTLHKGKLRVIVTEAKAARGQMASYIIKNRISEPDQLKNFNGHDFQFEESLSTPQRFVFIK